VFDGPTMDRIEDGQQQPLLKADHVEFHGRLVGGTVFDHPEIELALSLKHALLPAVHALATAPLDGDIVATLKGLKNFTPKPWAVRLHEIQANNGSIEINRLRLEQGPTLAIGKGTLRLDAQSFLNGKLDVTVAGLAPFLNAIGANVAVQNSPAMDKVAGFLDRLSPGLGDAARQQIGSHLSFGIKAIEGNATLEGRPAVALPLTVDKGAISLGPVPLGQIPPLF
ncbi:MAG TPA: DUF2125 domain-containing protein, partial [Pseudolabrys sp.]|nr:DUF2125 domain-containing protein [Pseudolabrys sp.]